MTPKCQKNKKLALDSGIQTNQILTNDDEVCIPRLSSILLAVLTISPLSPNPLFAGYLIEIRIPYDIWGFPQYYELA